jgi:hypothetical protein
MEKIVDCNALVDTMVMNSSLVAYMDVVLDRNINVYQSIRAVLGSAPLAARILITPPATELMA